jgi:hypothetical protein
MKLAVVIGMIFFAGVIQASGQACGRFYIRITVEDQSGKPITNANIALKAGTKDETQGKKFERDAKDTSQFTVAYSEGTAFSTPQLVSVSAPYFNTSEIPAIFTSCENLAAVVKLSKKGLPANAVWDFRVNVEAEVNSADEKFTKGAKLTVIDSAGKSQDIADFDKGYAFFDLPNGKYVFKFSAPGYEPRDENVDLTGLGRKSVIVELKKTN